MEITVRNEYRVEVGLTETEMERLGVRFETLDYGKLETRRALWTVVGELRRRGVEVRLSGKVLIEAEKTDAGCRLSITVLPPKGDRAPSVKQLVRAPKLPAVFVSADPALLKKAAARLGRARAALYALGNAAVLCVEDGCAENALLEAEEYLPCAAPAPDLLPFWLEEHARQLAAGDAEGLFAAEPF